MRLWVGNLLRNVELGADLFTDEWAAYNGLENFFAHKTIDHGREYVGHRPQQHHRGLLKRALKGTQVHVNPEHLHRYVTERTFADNLILHRPGPDANSSGGSYASPTDI